MKTLFPLALASLLFAGPLAAAELAPADQEFLAKYEPLRAALAADDLAAAKKAAAGLPGAEKITADATIAAARTDFGAVSDRAVKLARGVPGYFVLRCPMVNKEWVQQNKTISNPYMGKEMLTCGVVKS